ncbi:hypothetical protein DPMN_005253 [Dreissena polymorpha]|uniref:Uncharacterized protein n=1 Tax=Dreissena polymorpha TaxID=45954 RepID=A0A9D4MPX1_DREPO|nr:hypothetical protein DPMN_005253 [Dreissena polymorpha]
MFKTIFYLSVLTSIPCAQVFPRDCRGDPEAQCWCHPRGQCHQRISSWRRKGSSTIANRGVVVMERLMHYLLNEKVKQDGRKQNSLTDVHGCPEEVPPLSIEKYCTAGVSL